MSGREITDGVLSKEEGSLGFAGVRRRQAAEDLQLEAAEERRLNAWFRELESDTLELLEKLGGSDNPDQSNPLSRGVLITERLTDSQLRALSKAERADYRRGVAIYNIRTALFQLRLARNYALDGDFYAAVRLAHEAAISGVRGAAKQYERATYAAMGKASSKFENDLIRLVYDEYLRQHPPKPQDRKTSRYVRAHRALVADVASPGQRSIPPKVLTRLVAAYPKWRPPKTYRAIYNHDRRKSHRNVVP